MGRSRDGARKSDRLLVGLIRGANYAEAPAYGNASLSAQTLLPPSYFAFLITAVGLTATALLLMVEVSPVPNCRPRVVQSCALCWGRKSAFRHRKGELGRHSAAPSRRSEFYGTSCDEICKKGHRWPLGRFGWLHNHLSIGDWRRCAGRDLNGCSEGRIVPTGRCNTAR